MKNKSYNLVDVIDALRTDIDAAIEAGKAKDKTTYFELGEIEVELTTQITADEKGEGGLNFGVVKIGGSLNDSNTNTQKIKLKLIPKSKLTKDTDSDSTQPSNAIEISVTADVGMVQNKVTNSH